MGQTPSFSDHFARRPAPGANGVAVPGGRPDRFKEKAERAVAKKTAPAPAIQPKPTPAPASAAPKIEAPRDAFAPRPAEEAPRQNMFTRPRPAASAKSFAKPAPAASSALRPPEPKPPEPKHTGLRVVPSHPAFASLDSELVEVKYQDLKREEEARRKRMTKSSSLVLVNGGVSAAADVIDKPPPSSTDKPAAKPSAVTPPPLDIPPPKVRSGGGGSGGAKSVAAPRERTFTQDDFVGVVFGVAVLGLLLLWIMRGRPEEQADGRMLGIQSVSTEPLAAAPPPPAPLVDPFGDAPVNLKPTGPIPDPAPADPNAGVLEAMPAPAPPVAPQVAAPAVAAAPAATSMTIADRTMRAWFCTAGSGLTPGTKAAIEREMVDFKAAFAGKELVVRGYADTRGSSVYNAALSGERANVVADFLRANGLTVTEARGLGELEGLADNQNCANQRRVDVFVKGGPGETPSRACAPEPKDEELICG